jgi:hypothetical protein
MPCSAPSTGREATGEPTGRRRPQAVRRRPQAVRRRPQAVRSILLRTPGSAMSWEQIVTALGLAGVFVLLWRRGLG